MEITVQRIDRHESGSGDSRDLRGVVGPTGAVGVASVLAFLGHGCDYVTGGFIHLAEDREVRDLVEADGIGIDQKEL
jgi:hypothetical protein